MTQLPRLLWFLILLVACNPARAPASISAPPKLVAQRVTATVKREAARLVHLRTEHEAFVTTPEHPFATPEAGWVPAGRLVPGDQVVSVRFGTLRVLSAQNEGAVQSQAVFNLSVAPSHTYVVGTDQVLVHNKQCKDPAERDREIEAAERDLEALKLKLLLAVAEDKPPLQQRVAQLKSQITKLKHARAAARSRKKNAGGEPAPSAPELEVAPGPEASRSDVVGRTVRALERLDREIEMLKGTRGGSSQRLAELERERYKIYRLLVGYRIKDEQRRGIAVPFRQRMLRDAESDYQSRRRALEAAQAELSVLLGAAPRSDAEGKAQAERRVALEKELETLRLEHDASEAILDGERRFAELAARSPSTEAEREQIEAEQRALRDTIARKRKARRQREDYRKRRADPQANKELIRKSRHRVRNAARTDESEADTGRPRDTLAEDGASQERQETEEDEAAVLDRLLRELSESWGEGPSPERPVAQETDLQALQRELREERSAIEAADFALANEHAFLSQTLGHPGSSRYAAGAQRLAELQQQRLQLRIDWRARLQGRLDAARQELRTIQGIERLRDEAVEAELARRIALLEHEVNHPTF